MQAAQLGFAHQGIAVSHRETDVQIIPILSLTNGTDGREIPLHVVGKLGLGHHFVAIEATCDVIPLAATIDDLSTVMEFQRATNAWGVTHLINDGLAEYQWPVGQLIGRLGAVSPQEAVEI